MAESKKFIWVEVNRDHIPDLPKKFNVSAYPSLIVLGTSQEKVYRFQSYKKPPEFLADLAEGLKRWELYKAGKEWDTPNPRPEAITAAGTVETMRAPSSAVPAGMAFLGGDFWVAHMGTLYRLDAVSGEMRRSFQIEGSITDICTDGKYLFGVEAGWTAGRPVHQIDPETGKTVRQIVTEANKKNKASGAFGIAWVEGKLHILSGMDGTIYELDPATGDVTGKLQAAERWITGLDHDGAHFVVGTKTALILLDPKLGAVAKKIPMNYPLRSVAFRNGAYYLMEQPIFGFDTNNKSIQIWPKEPLIYKLTLNDPK